MVINENYPTSIFSTHLYFSRSITSMQDIQVMYRREAGPAGVWVDPEHMKVVAAAVRSHQQHAARVKLQRYDRFGVRYEVSHDWIAWLFAVLAVFFLITLK